MHFDIKGIMEGAFNSIFINEEIEKVAKDRLSECDICPHQSTNKKKADPEFKTLIPFVHCTLCGCNISMKVRSLSQECPDKPPRWLAQITEQEEWELDGKLEQEERMKSKT